MDLTESVYRITRLLPADERFVLGGQMRRASMVSPGTSARAISMGLVPTGKRLANAGAKRAADD